MGKIHKALEKSKKEQQQPQIKSFESMNYTILKDRRDSSDTNDNDPDAHNLHSTSNPKLETIHALLDDDGKKQTDKRAVNDSKDPIPSHHGNKTNVHDRVDQRNKGASYRSKIDSEVIKENRRERLKPSLRVDDSIDEKISTAIRQRSEDLITQKRETLTGTQDSGSTVPYFRKGGIPPQTDERETIQVQLKSDVPLMMHYSLVTLAKPKSFEAEQFKILRANLLFPKSGPPPKTILLTSAVPGEGKTFTAINLAVSLAQNLNSHVLLVDADIRKPDVHKRFGLGENILGLSDFLTKNVPIPNLLVKTPISNLTILPGGKTTINPSELISSEKMKKLISELSTRYNDRFVIIDAPPPKLAAETYALARFVEHIIPVIRSGRSNRELVEEMMNLLGRDKVKGVVLNCYDIRKTKRFGYHKYTEYYNP